MYFEGSIMSYSARPRGQKTWSIEEMKSIALNAGKMSIDLVTKEVNAIGGNNRPNGSIKKKAFRMGYSLVFKAGQC